MSVFFNQGGITVTDRVFIVGSGRYEVEHIDGAACSTGRLHPGVRTCAVIAAANAVFLVAAALSGQPAAVLLAALGALLVSGAVGLVYAWRRPRQQLLVASYHGRQVTLWRTHDRELFGRVCRALRRAIESSLTEQPL